MAREEPGRVVRARWEEHLVLIMQAVGSWWRVVSSRIMGPRHRC